MKTLKFISTTNSMNEYLDFLVGLLFFLFCFVFGGGEGGMGYIHFFLRNYVFPESSVFSTVVIFEQCFGSYN